MKNKLVIFVFLLVFFVSSAVAGTTPGKIKNHPHYKNSVELLKRNGKEKVIRTTVKLQREQMKQNGGSLDEYTTVIGIFGDQFGMTQTIQLKVDNMLHDLNQQHADERKKPISRDRIIAAMQPGGEAYKAQINMLCSNPSTRALIDNKIDYIMKIYDQRMTFISEIWVDYSTCDQHD